MSNWNRGVWNWLKCMYQVSLYMNIEFGARLQAWPEVRVFMTNTTFFKLSYITNWFKNAILCVFLLFQLAPLFGITTIINCHFYVFFNFFYPNRFQHIVYSWASLNHNVKMVSDTGSNANLCIVFVKHIALL